MTTAFTHRFASFAIATMLTLALLASVDLLATGAPAADLLARAASSQKA